jgi:hypothetical protein
VHHQIGGGSTSYSLHDMYTTVRQQESRAATQTPTHTTPPWSDCFMQSSLCCGAALVAVAASGVAVQRKALLLVATGCRPGFMLDGGVCTPCTKGSYCQGGAAARSVATGCAAGLTTVNMGSAENIDCGKTRPGPTSSQPKRNCS